MDGNNPTVLRYLRQTPIISTNLSVSDCCSGKDVRRSVVQPNLGTNDSPCRINCDRFNTTRILWLNSDDLLFFRFFFQGVGRNGVV